MSLAQNGSQTLENHQPTGVLEKYKDNETDSMPGKLSLSLTPEAESEEPQLAPNIAKKSKTSISTVLNLSSAELKSLTKEELISHIITLQGLVKASGATQEEWTAEKVAEKAEKLRTICANEIKKQMKWQVRSRCSLCHLSFRNGCGGF